MSSTKDLELAIVWVGLLQNLLALELVCRTQAEDEKEEQERTKEHKELVERVERLEAKLAALEQAQKGKRQR